MINKYRRDQIGPRLKTLWLATGFFLGLFITYGSLSPDIDAPQILPYQDKFQHAIAYTILCWWFLQWCDHRAQKWRVTILVFLLGLSLEIAQLFTPDRSSELADILANSAGVLIGALINRYLPLHPRHYFWSTKKTAN